MRLILTTFLLCFCNCLLSQDKIIIKDIIITGNKITKEEIITRELIFKKFDEYTKNELEKKIKISTQNLTNLNLFNFIKINTEFKKNYVVIKINFTERWYIWPYPIFELSDRNFNSWIEKKDINRTNYGIFFNWENFRGKNELVKIKFRRGFKEHYQFLYRAPFINNKKTLGLEANIEQFRRKETHYNTVNNKLIYYNDSLHNNYTSKDYKFSTQISYRKHINITHQVHLSYFLSFIDSNIINLNPIYLDNNKNSGSYGKISYKYCVENRDYIIYPLTGNYLMLEANKYIQNTSPINHFELIGKVEKHIQLKPRFFLGSSLKIKKSTSKYQPYFSQESLGFDNYIRGYEYYVIDNQEYWISKTIMKWEIIKNKEFDINFVKMKQFNKSYYSLYLSIFSDLGYAKNHQNHNDNPLANILLWGKGISIDYLTYYDKLLRIEYSINHLGEKGVFLHLSNPF